MPDQRAELCRMRLDGARLLREHDVLLKGPIRCTLPEGHDYLHHGDRGEIWGAEWAVCDD